MNTYDENTPVGALTVGQLLELIEKKLAARKPEPKPEPEPKADRVGIDEIKQFTGLSKSQIYQLTMNNAIPHRKFGRRLVFSIKEVAAWMEQNTIGKETSKQKAARQLAKLAMKRVKT